MNLQHNRISAEKTLLSPPSQDKDRYLISFGLQTAPLRGVTLPQLSQTYFISATIGAQTCRGSLLEMPQCRHTYAFSTLAGEQRWERVFVTFPQVEQAYMVGFFTFAVFVFFFFFVVFAIRNLLINYRTQLQFGFGHSRYPQYHCQTHR